MSSLSRSSRSARNCSASFASKRLKSVFVIFIIENIFDRPVNTDVLFLLLKPECISRRQIAFSVASEAVNIGSKRRIAKDRRQISARSEEIEIDPKLLK